MALASATACYSCSAGCLGGRLDHFAAGQLLEAAGAWGYDENERVSLLADVHDVAVYVGVAGLVLTMLGLLMSVIVAGAAHFELLESRWMPVALGFAVLAAVAFVIDGIIFDY